MSNYDDPVNEAWRLINLWKDREDTQQRLAELVPLLLEKIEETELEDRASYSEGYDEGYRDGYDEGLYDGANK